MARHGISVFRITIASVMWIKCIELGQALLDKRLCANRISVHLGVLWGMNVRAMVEPVRYPVASPGIEVTVFVLGCKMMTNLVPDAPMQIVYLNY
jgi:hypothetical protein